MIKIIQLDRRFRGYDRGFRWAIKITGGQFEWQRKSRIVRVLNDLHGTQHWADRSAWPWATHVTGSSRNRVTNILVKDESDLTFLRLKGALDQPDR